MLEGPGPDIRVPLVASGYFTSEVGLAIAHLVKEIVYLKRKSGLLFTALYLKQCQVALQRFYAGSSIKEEALPVTLLNGLCSRLNMN